MENNGSAQAKRLFELAFGKRPTEELYDLRDDPWQMNNVAKNPAYDTERNRLRAQLNAYLLQTRDPRASGSGDVFDHYFYVTTQPTPKAREP